MQVKPLLCPNGVNVKEAAMKTIKKIDVQTSPTLKFPKKSSAPVATLLDQLSDIRDQERKHVATGRKWLMDAMTRIYGIWHDANSGGQLETFMNNVRQKLKQEEIRIYENSRKSAQLIRYVFEGFSDKQVSIYSRVLEKAYDSKPRIRPSDFESFVTEGGGFEKLGVGSDEGNTGKSDRTAAKALAKVQKDCQSFGCFNDDTWDASEECRIYVGIQDAAGEEVELKYLRLSQAAIQATLLKYYDEASAKPKGKQLNESERREIAKLKSRAAGAEEQFAELELEFSEARKAGKHPQEIADLTAKLKTARTDMEQAKKLVKDRETQLKQDAQPV